MLENQRIPIPSTRFRAEFSSSVAGESFSKFSKTMADGSDFTYMKTSRVKVEPRVIRCTID